VIREIDYSKEVLHNIISKLEDKKNVLEEIEQQIEDTSMTLLSSMEYNKSSFEEEHTKADSSSRVERTQVQDITNRPRASGARISPQKIIHEMEMSQEIETGLLSQRALGSPRDRHSGAPDAAGSTVTRRESCEGTAGVDLDSAPAEQIATVEKKSVETAYRDPVEKTEDNTAREDHEERKISPPPEEAYIYPEEYGEALPLPVVGKRKASTSPDSKDEDNEITTHRPRKARVIVSESPLVELKQTESYVTLDRIVISSEEDSTEESSSIISTGREKEAPLTRSAKKKKNEEILSKSV